METLDLCKDSYTGAARLSSARLVRGMVQSQNERNPYAVLYVSQQTAPVTESKVRTTSSQRGPYALGYTHVTMDATKGCQPARGS